MRKSVQKMKVIRNLRLNSDHALITLLSEIKLDQIIPGQFANILVDKSSNIFLRRPFSIHRVDYKCNTVDFLIKGVGEGTKILSNVTVGEELSIIMPLGKGFSIPLSKLKVLLVGGGCGVAPLMHLADTLHEAGQEIEILLGARKQEDLVELDSYSRFAILHTTTEDGSHGIKGFVTDHPVITERLSDFHKVYCCGPEPMMKAVAQWAKNKNVSCEVSLENTMACGYGVCLCCVTETIDGNKCVCTEGPVFDIKQLKWQI